MEGEDIYHPYHWAVRACPDPINLKGLSKVSSLSRDSRGNPAMTLNNGVQCLFQ